MQSDRYYHHSDADVEMETQRGEIISTRPRSVLTSHMSEPTFLTVGSIFSLQRSYLSLTLTVKLFWATPASEFLNFWRIHSFPHLLKFYSLALLGVLPCIYGAIKISSSWSETRQLCACVCLSLIWGTTMHKRVTHPISTCGLSVVFIICS